MSGSWQVKSSMYFEIIGEIENIEEIAVGGRIRDIMRIHKHYGAGRCNSLVVFTKKKRGSSGSSHH